MSFENLLVPNTNTIYAKNLSLTDSIDTGNGSSSQIYGTGTTTTTALTTIKEYALSNGKYIVQIFANANTTAGPQVNGGISQIGSAWLNVVGNSLSITVTEPIIENRYVYGAGVLTYSLDVNPITANVLQIKVQNSFAGNTTKWTVVANIYGLSSTNF